MLKQIIKKYGSFIFGQTPCIHRIPFGAIKGYNIFTSFNISPRMYFGINEPWIAKLAQKYLKPSDTVFDIGAHIGYTTLLFRHYIGATGSVHAFEILGSVARDFFQKTMDANNIKNVVIHPTGLSNSEISLDLPVGETLMACLDQRNSFTQTTEIIERCNTVRLDDFVIREKLPIPSLIKIDIEGAEIDCLKGGLDLIKNNKPVLIVEFHNLRLLEDGYNLLHSLGYTMFTQKQHVDRQMISRLKSFHSNVLCLHDKEESTELS